MINVLKINCGLLPSAPHSGLVLRVPKRCDKLQTITSTMTGLETLFLSKSYSHICCLPYLAGKTESENKMEKKDINLTGIKSSYHLECIIKY